MTASVPLQHIIDNPLNVQSDDCPAAFVGLQEEALVGVVMEEILRQGGSSLMRKRLFLDQDFPAAGFTAFDTEKVALLLKLS